MSKIAAAEKKFEYYVKIEQNSGRSHIFQIIADNHVQAEIILGLICQQQKIQNWRIKEIKEQMGMVWIIGTIEE